MAVKLNRKGYSHARRLIEAGKVDKDSSWSFDAEDGNKILGDPPDWDEYGRWFLAVETEAPEDTKEHWKFPFGKNGKVYRRGVIAAKQRAAQQGYTEIANAADRLLQLIDKEEKAADLEVREEPPTESRMLRFSALEERAIDEERREIEVSFSSEQPVERWFGREILLHAPKAVDLGPIRKAGSVLRNHDPNQIIGRPVKVWLDEEGRRGKARIRFGSTPAAELAFKEVKEGLLRGVSFGYRVYEWKRLEEDEEWEGFHGPAWIATRWDVVEISLTPIPADATVGVGRALHINNEKEVLQMGKEKDIDRRAEVPEPEPKNVPDPQAAVKAERERVTEIMRLCREFDLEELADELITSGTSVEEARKVILDKLAERKPPVGGVGVQVIEDERDKFSRAAQDALLLRVGARVEQPAPGAEDLRGLTLLELAKECLRRANIPLVGDRMAIVQRAFTHTSSDFPIILQNVVNKQLVDAYTEVPTTYQLWTRKASASDFKAMWRVWFSSAPKLIEVPEGGEYKQITFSEAGESYAIGTYGAMFSITRQAIINDDLDAFQRIPRLFGSAARRTVNETVYAILKDNPTMADGKALFHADHNNLGTAGAIGEDTLNEALRLMMEQKDASGEAVLGIAPRFLIVPPALKTTALKWLKSTALPADNKSSKVFNPFQDLAELVVDACLGAAGGGSDTAWYMAADPNVIDTIEVAFLDGNETPQLETERGFEVDGMRFKVRLDFGAKAIDWRGLFKNAGA
ncbi:MAG TPA: peptidase [Chloroflexi bacterium]|nr:peptidase [Chloroflexota bacterium]